MYVSCLMCCVMFVTCPAVKVTEEGGVCDMFGVLGYVRGMLDCEGDG